MTMTILELVEMIGDLDEERHFAFTVQALGTPWDVYHAPRIYLGVRVMKESVDVVVLSRAEAATEAAAIAAISRRGDN